MILSRNRPHITAVYGRQSATLIETLNGLLSDQPYTVLVDGFAIVKIDAQDDIYGDPVFTVALK